MASPGSTTPSPCPRNPGLGPCGSAAWGGGTFTSCRSWCDSWLCGSLSFWVIHGCCRTCLAVRRWWGSTCSILDTRSWGRAGKGVGGRGQPGSRVLGLADGDWLRQPFPAVSRLDPCSSPCNPFSTLLQGLLEWHTPFLGISSWKALSFLFHHLEATQEGGKNQRLGLGRIKT